MIFIKCKNNILELETVCNGIIPRLRRANICCVRFKSIMERTNGTAMDTRNIKTDRWFDFERRIHLY